MHAAPQVWAPGHVCYVAFQAYHGKLPSMRFGPSCMYACIQESVWSTTDVNTAKLQDKGVFTVTGFAKAIQDAGTYRLTMRLCGEEPKDQIYNLRIEGEESLVMPYLPRDVSEHALGASMHASAHHALFALCMGTRYTADDMHACMQRHCAWCGGFPQTFACV